VPPFLARLWDGNDHGVDPVIVLSYGAAGAFVLFQGYALLHGEPWHPDAFGMGLAAILAPMVPGLFRKPPSGDKP
jgi:hypothetical protein